ncbi:MAG: hypothetical protein OJF49_001291 [Ktedonobacterales bacterium]|jgi:hypothetical protein|nr:MAG: hypothetical protein OJF49_001291 [Ktedonobacterales bacterium]
MRLGLRTLGMISGLVGTGIALILDILYSLAHVLGRVTNISNDTGHLWWGLLFVIVALVGSLAGLVNATVGALLLVIAAIAFFFVIGPWALLTSPFMLLGAVLIYAGRGERMQATA